MPASADSPARAPGRSDSHPLLSIGEVAAQLAGAVEQGNVLFAAADEARAVAVTRALAAMTSALVVFCPGSDALPGDNAPASPANVGQRVAALRRVRLGLLNPARPGIACITTGEALAQLYAPPAAFDAAPPHVAVGQTIELADLFDQLLAVGYTSDERVDEPGEVALRGQVLDVYPADADQPLRIDAVDGQVAAIRSYDPGDQRTTGECDEQELGRVAEPAADGTGVTLLEHLPEALLAIEPAADRRRRRFLALAADAERRHPNRALRSVATEARWQEALAGRETLALSETGEAPPRFVEAKAPQRAFNKTARAAIETGERILILGSARDLRFLRRRVAAALKLEVADVTSWAEARAAAAGEVLALECPIDRGFRSDGVLAVAAADLLGSRAERDGGSTSTSQTEIFGVGEIQIGDVVVHEDHGIGLVAGLAPMPETGGGDAGDAIALRYAGDSSRLVPVSEANRLWRYGADPDVVTLDKLDGSTWAKRRGDIDAAIAETARSLVALAEERARRTAPVLEPDPAAYERFAASFPYSETRDQARAIEAVRTDLASGRPMERLVIGDVGYGKTEVAMRAAAFAALAGHQVAVAAPTTVLARQHLEQFAERFADSGIAVAGLSRLSSAAEKKRVKEGLADGSIDIVVGTGAVAGKGVEYAKLALVIVDEEQRFGAADKARLRDIAAGHVLALSATPIPRTLQAALIGLQQLSIIATPPARRQPIRTAVGTFDEGTLRTALLRERSRGGQSFVVVPRIEDMAGVAALLAKLVPELELLQAHGKMRGSEIDEAMVRFGRGDGDVLLATNIIEAGLDVPRANTMVIWRADRFGLSQLHQLRGRVGRSSRRGQVLLLTEAEKAIAPRTLKRLRTLEAFDRLGAGFAISLRDLDMRGAGDILGEAQAGHMKLIGIDLYQHLLGSALRAARGEPADRWSPELKLGISGRLPDSWIPEEELRVTLYARLSHAEEIGEIDALSAELEDRFGSLPEEAVLLLSVARIRAAARAALIERIDAGPAAIAFTPRPDFAGDGVAVGLVEKDGRWLLAERIDDAASRLARIEALLEELAPA